MEKHILENDHIRLSVLPTCGGKIASLFNKQYEEECLWANAEIKVCEPVFGQNYVQELDSGGWDEVFPSVDPCIIGLLNYSQVQLPDHGDLVQLPWMFEQLSADRFKMSVVGKSLPFCFERSLALEENSIRLTYRVENCGEIPFPWLWCAHPLVPISTDLSLEALGVYDVLYAQGAAEALIGHSVRLHELPSWEASWAAKLFSQRGAVNSVVVRQGRRFGLQFEWDPEKIPYLGLWINNGAWSGCAGAPYYNIGIEPATLPADDLSIVEEPPLLGAGKSEQWELIVKFID